MTLNVLNNFNIQTPRANRQNFGTSYIMPAPTGYHQEAEFFDDTDTEAAKNTGGILLAGIAIREVLKRISSKMFSSYFSKNPDVNPSQLTDIGLQMLQDKGLMQNPVKQGADIGTVYSDGLKKLSLIIENNGNNAYFDHINKQIRVSKNTLLSLPHEIGHAVEENSTTFFKALQRFRGNYTMLALILYGLGRSKSTNKKGKETFIGKIQNTLYKYNLLVPLIAFSPELITEFKASKIGLDYLKQIKAPKNIIKAARKHYAIAFCTYLALPAFAVLDNLIIKKAFSSTR